MTSGTPATKKQAVLATKKTAKTKSTGAKKAAPKTTTAPVVGKAQKVSPEKVPPVSFPAPAVLTSELKVLFQSTFKKRNALIAFLLDFIPLSESAGLEMASFRRAELLRTQLGVEPWLLTNMYQPASVDSAIRQIKLGRLSIAHMANMYDFLQGIDRSKLKRQTQDLVINQGWKVAHVQGSATDLVILDSAGNQVLFCRRQPDGKSLDYVNFLKNGKIIRRDSYDPLGFMSRTQFLDENNFAHTVVYYRPDHTVALTETYKPNQEHPEKPLVEAINVMDEKGFSIQRFFYHDELVAYWLLRLLSDKKVTYLCIADQIMEYQRYFTEVHRQQNDYPNIRIVGVAHSNHCIDPTDTMHSQIGDNYRFLIDPNQRMDRVITLTQWQKDDIIERFGAQAHPISVIPHHFEYEDAKNDKNDSKAQSQAKQGTAGTDESAQALDPTRDIVLIGRFAPGKNHEMALGVIEEIRKKVPKARLHFYGSGPLEKELREKVHERGLDEVVIFHGFISNLRPVYDSAAFLLSCSRFEGFPLVLQEALTAGCPVISFDCRYGPRAMIEEGKSGFLIPAYDTEPMIERCVQLLTDHKLRKSMSSYAKESMKRFTIGALAAVWAKVLTEVLNEERPDEQA